jgi:hypothetical protein
VETQLRGWRRARKQGASALRALADAATGFWWVLVMVAAGAVGWFLFTRGLVESRWYPGHVVPLRTLAYFAASLFAAGVGFQTLFEAKGGSVIGFFTILVGVFPSWLARCSACSPVVSRRSGSGSPVFRR